MAGPFAGVRIIDISSVLMGPLATELLADLGADVIKVESPDGDILRGIGPSRNRGMSSMFLTVNRNKRSVVLDLKTHQGRDALLKLVADADVLFFNIRPQAMRRLGLAYEAVRAANPRAIYCGAYGFAQDGPYAAKPAYDDLIQGAAGIPSLAQRMTDRPSYAPFALSDHMCGLYAAFCLSAALFHQRATGEGQAVEVPMFETMAQVVLTHHIYGRAFEPPLGPAGYSRHLSPNRRPYPTADGYVCAQMVTDAQWRRFFGAVGLPRVLEDPRFSDIEARTANAGALCDLIEKEFAKRPTSEWLSLLEKLDIPSMPMNTLEQLLDDAHLRSIGFFRQVDHPSEGAIVGMKVPSSWSETRPDEFRAAAPALGQHTREVLAEAGLSAEEIEAIEEARQRNAGRPGA